jgi:hypothetical protein
VQIRKIFKLHHIIAADQRGSECCHIALRVVVHERPIQIGVYQRPDIIATDQRQMASARRRTGLYSICRRMKFCWLMIFATAAAMAQESAPSGFLHGQLLSWTGTPRAGEFTFQATGDHLYFCSYDDKTYFEREKQHITIAGTEKGDRLEVVSDQRVGSTVCYARTVHVLDDVRVIKMPGIRPKAKPATLPDLAARRGSLTFSGVVLKATPDMLYIRSRAGERSAIRLRPDTRYLMEGEPAAVGSLRANLIIFVRAGKNLDNEVEAYQVIWGEILQPEQ